jgi:hypothetical protein
MSSQKQLVETALQVLVSWINGMDPAPTDLKILRTAFPSSAHLPADELACQVIHDLSGRAFPGHDRDPQAKSITDEVA